MIMKKHNDVDIILPCFNPTPGWEKLLVVKYYEILDFWRDLEFHLYIVNDGSTYGFGENEIEYIKMKIPNICFISYKENHGKGYALREAVKICRSKYVIYTDYDFPYTLKSISLVIEALLQGTDIVMVIRDKQYYRNLSLIRKFISYTLRKCNKYILRMQYQDTQAGLKGFNQKGRSVFMTTQINSYIFDLEFIYIASRTNQLTICEIPAITRDHLLMSIMDLKTYYREFIQFVNLYSQYTRDNALKK